jgi:hypothetical protein
MNRFFLPREDSSLGKRSSVSEIIMLKNDKESMLKKIKHIDEEIETLKKDDIFAAFDTFQMCDKTLPREIRQLVLDIACSQVLIAKNPNRLYRNVLTRSYSFATDIVCVNCKQYANITPNGNRKFICECGHEIRLCIECCHPTLTEMHCNRQVVDEDEDYSRCSTYICANCARREVPEKLHGEIHNLGNMHAPNYIEIDDFYIDVMIDIVTGKPCVIACADCYEELKSL